MGRAMELRNLVDSAAGKVRDMAQEARMAQATAAAVGLGALAPEDAEASIAEESRSERSIADSLAAGTGTAIAGIGDALNEVDKATSPYLAPVMKPVNWALDATEIPARGLHGLAAALGVLTETGDMDAAVARGAEVSGKPLYEIATELDDYVTKQTGSGAAGTTTLIGTLLADPAGALF